MKKFILCYTLFISLNAFSQAKECGIPQLTFRVNEFPYKDTLGDLILRSNGYTYVRGAENILFLNKGISSLNYTISGATFCYYKNDSTLIITPNSSSWEFSYIFKGNHFFKNFISQIWKRRDLNVQFDNRIQVKGKNLVNFNTIDSLTFDLEPCEYAKWLPKENFRYTISTLTITLARNYRPIKTEKFNLNTSFYIGAILQKAEPGDKLIIDYYPQWIQHDGSLSYMNCGGFEVYTLGKKK